MIQTLLKSEHFLPKSTKDKFEISSNEIDSYVDVNAMVLTISNIEMFLSEPQSKQSLCEYFIEVNYIGTLCLVPSKLKVNYILTASSS